MSQDNDGLYIDRRVCEFYHTHLKKYAHIYMPEVRMDTETLHACNILDALTGLLGTPLINRHEEADESADSLPPSPEEEG